MTRELRTRALLAIILLLGAAVAGLWWNATRELEGTAALVRHTQDVERLLERLDGALAQVESGGRGFALTGDARLKQAELRGEEEVQTRSGELRVLTADNPRQQRSLDELSGYIDNKLRFSEKLMQARASGGLPAAASFAEPGLGGELMLPVRAALDRMRAEEEMLLARRQDAAERVRKRAMLLGSGVLGLLLLGLITFIQLSISEARGRRRAAEATRKSEERLRLLLGAVREYAIFELSPDGVVQTANGAAAQIFGADPVGAHIDEFYPADAVALGMPQRELSSAAELGQFEDQGPRRRASGELFWADVVTTAIRDGQGTLRGYAKVVRDVSERKNVDDALRETARRLETSNRELQDFAMIASHDLQEPLRKVQMFGDKLKRRYSEQLGEEGRDWLVRMMNAAARGQSLIQGLLAFSRVTTKAQPPTPVDLAQVAQEVVSDLEARITDVGGRVEVGELPVVEADPLQMRQLLQNLIGNALKFRRPDSPPVVTLEAKPAGFGHVEIVVSDNGIGFDPKYTDRIFKLFQRLHERGTYEGSGMGLAICRKIVERHGGKISASSQPGIGTRFFVDLPEHQPVLLAH